MTDKKETHFLRERIGMTVLPTDPATLVANLVEIEEAGVDHVWIAVGAPWSADVLTTLAAAAARTAHLKFGTYIVQASTRHPVLMAQQALSFSLLAPGRLRLGIGTGLPEPAKNIYGVEMERPLAYLREYAQVLRPLLQRGEVHHQGHYFTTDASLQASSQVPLFISTLGPAAFRLAGEITDGALPSLCPIPYLLNTAIPALDAGAAKAGHTRPPVVADVPIAFTENRAIGLQAGRQAMSFYLTLPTYRNMFAAAGFSAQEIDMISDSLVESVLVFGDESKIKDRLLELLPAGIDELTLRLVPVFDAIQEGTRLARLIGQMH
jgi:alkanesulfonate monooxygenase SsuD/methylene tetrahydromethanopterin reductase-like flavin-dependent oxidoreductase (luciferase family)